MSHESCDSLTHSLTHSQSVGYAIIEGTLDLARRMAPRMAGNYLEDYYSRCCFVLMRTGRGPRNFNRAWASTLHGSSIRIG